MFGLVREGTRNIIYDYDCDSACRLRPIECGECKKFLVMIRIIVQVCSWLHHDRASGLMESLVRIKH